MCNAIPILSPFFLYHPYIPHSLILRIFYFLAVGVCCCLQTRNSIVYVVVMGLVLGQSLMVISTTGIILYAKVSPLYNVLWE